MVTSQPWEGKRKAFRVNRSSFLFTSLKQELFRTRRVVDTEKEVPLILSALMIKASCLLLRLLWSLSSNISVCVPPLSLLSDRFALSAVDMEQRDYDSRTALHVAAAEGDTSHHQPIFTPLAWALTFMQQSEKLNVDTLILICSLFFLSGHQEAVIFLTEICKVNPLGKDR